MNDTFKVICATKNLCILSITSQPNLLCYEEIRVFSDPFHLVNSH